MYGQYYKIKQNDKLSSIAQRFGTTVNEIMALNSGIDPQRLYIGQIIIVKAFPIYIGIPKTFVALTFDSDGAAEDQTERLLSILDQNKIKATFFLSGEWVKYHWDLAGRISQAGHEIGNHGYYHTVLSLDPDHPHPVAELIKEIRDAEDMIYSATRKVTRLYRPPEGVYKQSLINAVNCMGYDTILWSIDPMDYTNPGVNVIVKRVVDKIDEADVIKVKQGVEAHIILLHQFPPQTPEALQWIISELTARGVGFGTVTQALMQYP